MPEAWEDLDLEAASSATLTAPCQDNWGNQRSLAKQITEQTLATANAKPASPTASVIVGNQSSLLESRPNQTQMHI